MLEETLSDVGLSSKPKGRVLPRLSLREKADAFLISLIVILSVFVLIISLKLHIFHLWADFLRSNTFLRLSTIPLLISGAVIIAGLIFRTILWFQYRPLTVEQEKEEKIDWPSVTVIIPAFNEEELISKSIDSIFSCNYPQEKLEVICINDGSKDRTYFFMMKAKDKYGKRLKVVNFCNNLGKRKALYVGLKRASGEIIVTVDSDSKISRDAVKNLVLPLIKDKNTGAVSGRVAVLNEKDNLLTSPSQFGILFPLILAGLTRVYMVLCSAVQELLQRTESQYCSNF